MPGGLTRITDINGRWEYLMMPPGTYTLTEDNQPAGFRDGLEQDGDPNGPPATVLNDRFENIRLQPTPIRGPFNFGEILSDPSKRDFLNNGNTGVSGTIFPNLPLSPAFTVTTGTPNQPALLATASDRGAAPVVRVFDYATGGERFRFLAYEPNYTGGVRVATGDVNGDGTPDIVAATGQGGGPRIRVFSGKDGAILQDFFAFETEFRGGVFVAVADVNADGKADILAGTELGGGPRLRVFSGANPAGPALYDFFAFDSNQRGGLRVAASDFNNDGYAEMVATAGRGNLTRVRVFDGKAGGMLGDFQPYDAAFTRGVYIAAGDVTGDGVADIVTAADIGGGPHVQVFNGLTGASAYSFFADSADYRGGIRVAVLDVNGDGKKDIVTGTGIDHPARVRVWTSGSATALEEFHAFDASYLGGAYVE